jgi:hypothetical protein
MPKKEKSEADFAMMYAEEARMRVELQDRINSMIFDVYPFVGSILAFFAAITDKNADKVIEYFSRSLLLAVDVQQNMHMNMIDAVGEELMSKSEIDQADSMLGFEAEVLDRIRDVCHEANKRTDVTWEKLCDRHGLASKGKLRAERKKQINEIMQEIAKVLAHFDEKMKQPGKKKVTAET